VLNVVLWITTILLWSSILKTVHLYVWHRQSFTMHLMRLMTSWAVVCDVWYLEPQTIKAGETPIEFSERYVLLI